MIPELIGKETTDNGCGLAERWRISEELALKLVYLAQIWPTPLEIISGYRSPEEQTALARDPTNMAATVGRSTHTMCPATGADLWIGIRKADFRKNLEMIRFFGSCVQRVGLRWGGGSPLEPEGIPSDWNHVDLGPRPYYRNV